MWDVDADVDVYEFVWFAPQDSLLRISRVVEQGLSFASLEAGPLVVRPASW